ncbi:MAG: hypothetical protein COA38_08880 [Fluviicola sp.]|nr:MAG: hypothetical protein COA38_08880 [Fluviicola sp.]
MNENWKHIKTIIDSEPYEINGLNIWDYEWKRTGNSIDIKDPNYGQDYSFTVYEISDGTKTSKFAAGEFSNCAWGIYMEQNQ